MTQIDEKAFFQLAFKAYDNPHCVSIEEFEDDLLRFSYIKKILTQYSQNQEINERLFLNHIVICFNLFGNKATVLLLHRVPKDHWGYLFPFLILLNRLPEVIPEFNLITTDILLDQKIVEKLRNL
jgi:hypothetical protein